MQPGIRRARSFAPLVGLSFSMLAAVATAQAPSQGPVAAMFADDQKRDQSLALSFLSVDLPAAKSAAFPAHVYLSAGDLERAFDRAEFRPDAAVIPTNTDLQIAAASPATQRVLVDRVRKQADVMRDLEDQIAARRKQSPAPSGRESGVLRIGLDSFIAQLPRSGNTAPTGAAFPKAACLVATDYADGGAVDQRELFGQDRVRKAIAACLAGLDTGGAQTVVLPLMGAGSSKIQTNDPMFEGQRTLKECRLINSTAGIALGIHDFAAGRRNLREIGLVQWDQEITGMFKVPAGSRAAQSAQVAYRSYAEQVKQAFRKGLAGQKTVASDLNGTCNAVFNTER